MLKRHKPQKRDKRKMQGMINERWQKLMKDKDFLIHTNFLQTKEKNDLARENTIKKFYTTCLETTVPMLLKVLKTFLIQIF